MQVTEKHATMVTEVTEDGKIICPLCDRPTQHRARPDTSARNLPIWCKLCHKESIVNIDQSLSQRRETSA